MPLTLQQAQKQQQRLVMTPQMQQSVKLLQMNTLELQELTEQELLENPFLEMEVEALDVPGREEEVLESQSQAEVIKTRDGDDEDDPRADDSYDTSPGDGSESGQEKRDESGSDVSEDLESNSVEDQPEQFSEVDTDFEEIFQDSLPRTYTPRYDEEDDDRSYEEIVAGRASLYEKLEWQLRVSALEAQDATIGMYLIGCIDDSGYLQADLAEVAERFDTTVEEVERVLGVVQEFEPTGVGARGLAECLCIQLRALGDLTAPVEAILREHWDALVRKKFRDVARAMEMTEAEVQAVFERISRLDPSPGRNFTKDQPQYIQPDVYVRYMDGEYVCYLHEGEVAHLRLNNKYKEILLGDPEGQDPTEREYALDKYRAAVMFLKNIEKRRSTILRVTESIMEYQREFLERGVEALRPLALSEIAERVSMHESTISRVTSGKYVDTPRGLFELKFFFSSAIEAEDGEAVSSRAIRRKIKELIDAEDRKKPLSDDRIAKILQGEGFSIARRTVAKYRTQMNILPTNLRRDNS